MPSQSLLQPYIIKKIVVEIRHAPDLLRADRARTVLNEVIDQYETIKVSGIDIMQQSIQLTSRQFYRTLVVEWNRLGITLENPRDLDDAQSSLKKYFVSVISKFDLKVFTRFGVRVTFVFPFGGSFELLTKFYAEKIVKRPGYFESIGKVNDYGLTAMTFDDGRYKINLSMGPFSRAEVSEKISEFKGYSDNFENALVLDLDLYQAAKASYKVGPFLTEALDSARFKAHKFYEALMAD